MPGIVYFDLETQRTSGDAGGWTRKDAMGMSVGVTYNTADGEYRIYTERRADELVAELLSADLVVGYNILNFDYEVLMGYTVLDLKEQTRTLDLMLEIERSLGRRLKLEAVAQATLGVGKTAEGLDAIRWWREGKLREIAEYCCYDVKITRLVHEFGAREGKVRYLDRFGRPAEVAVAWGAAPAGGPAPRGGG